MPPYHSCYIFGTWRSKEGGGGWGGGGKVIVWKENGRVKPQSQRWRNIFYGAVDPSSILSELLTYFSFFYLKIVL